MGPRHEDRGEPSKLGNPAKTVPLNGSFNGATARRPWRTYSSTGAKGPRLAALQWGHGTKTVENCSGGPGLHRQTAKKSFNGATARRPWRTSTERLDGSTNGLSFNGATARRPWRTRSRQGLARENVAPLQWGHGTKTVENVQMLPTLAPCTWIQASMGPRHEDRGELNGAAAPSWRHRCLLQWGHGTKAVERRAEMSPPLGAGLRRAIVDASNGATAFRPWKVDRFTAVAVPARLPWSLQWGHGAMAVEESGETLTTTWIAAGRAVRFNGATARRPWKALPVRTRITTAE